ncbi:E3 ubiquitin/ISG15 ligase TRIM25 [Nannospalax galili]|uniref:E3 ubiquitin/ISG15 ligase TRIM25 n=1 Tax=Nannospalax galili TaxID=1026970 RepID=UPI0004ED08D3|nr:E3 ubiquitin/ISG15 ligase TRIM25 [Nannospalax galili]
MYSHINGATKALEDVRARQQNTQESTNRKMEQLRQEYKEMKALIDAAEASSTQKIKEEEERVSSKFDTIYQVLLKKKSEMNNLKAEIELSLTKGDEFEFLEVSDLSLPSSVHCSWDLIELETGEVSGHARP